MWHRRRDAATAAASVCAVRCDGGDALVHDRGTVDPLYTSVMCFDPDDEDCERSYYSAVDR